MSEEATLSGASTEGKDYRIDNDLRYVPQQRRLAKLAYRLACAGPFAFLVMAMMYPKATHALPPLPVQALFWTLCLCSPCGAALGACALLLFRNRTLGYRRLSFGYAGAGLVVGVVASASLLFCLPTLDHMRRYNNAIQVNCESNVRQLALGVVMYLQDYDERYPLTNTWNDAITPYTRHESIFHCPSVEEEAEEKLPTYAMNRRLTALPADSIEQMDIVMLFDSLPGKNLAGGTGLFPAPLRHGAGRGNTIGYLDQHVKLVSIEHFSELHWSPKLTSKPAASQATKSETTSP